MRGYKPAGTGFNGVQDPLDITASVGNILHEGECVTWNSLTDRNEELVLKCAAANSPKFCGVLYGADNLDLRNLDVSGNPIAALNYPLTLAGPGDETLVKISGTCSKGDRLITSADARMKKLVMSAPLQANIANNATSLTILASAVPDGLGMIAAGATLRIGYNRFTIGTITGPAGSPSVYTVPITFITGADVQIAHTTDETIWIPGTYYITGKAMQACSTTGMLIQCQIKDDMLVIT